MQVPTVLQGVQQSAKIAEAFLHFLAQRLQTALPAAEAHQKMMPEGRLLSPSKGVGTYQSAVLVALCLPSAVPEISVLFTLRSVALQHHAGQMSFPGGRMQQGELPEDAAVREFREEVDPTYPQANLTILGRLSPLYIPVSFFWVYPVLAYLQQLPRFAPNPEVDRIYLVSLEWLRDREHIHRCEQQRKNGSILRYPCWELPGESVPLWGATAMIVAELVWIYEEFLSRFR